MSEAGSDDENINHREPALEAEVVALNALKRQYRHVRSLRDTLGENDTMVRMAAEHLQTLEWAQNVTDYVQAQRDRHHQEQDEELAAYQQAEGGGGDLPTDTAGPTTAAKCGQATPVPSAEAMKRGATGNAVGRPTKRVNRLMNLVWSGIPIITEEDCKASRRIEQEAEANDDDGEESSEQGSEEESAEEETEGDTRDNREEEGDEEAKQDEQTQRRSTRGDENDSDYNPSSDEVADDD
ncbi:hypothetical protein V7S43_007092 [Phytophthora oleae]|uniref:INO80 complex subunit B-like conserved region domain-containing protein n=1 Tax=Phytophthora oleae TaxID=2107226 RepID=A0ABD3FNU2_9STRA